jgi:hypothetical protein
VHEHDGLLPLQLTAWLLQSALVHAFEVSHDAPVHSAGHVHVQLGLLPETAAARLLQSALFVHV